MCADISGCHNGGRGSGVVTAGILWVMVRDAANHPTIRRTATTPPMLPPPPTAPINHCLARNVNNAEVDKLCSELIF